MHQPSTKFKVRIGDDTLSVSALITRWYCVKVAQPIVKLSSLPGPGSPMILVF